MGLGSYKPSPAALNFANKMMELFIGDDEYISTYIGRPEIVEQKRLAVALAFDVALGVAKSNK